MNTEECIAYIKERASAGIHTARIAAELGVSRQYVHTLARTYRIAIPAQSFIVPIGDSRPVNGTPQARVVTGGIPQLISQVAAGLVSELLVAADLTARNWKVFLPYMRNHPHDLIAVRDDFVLTIEVRSAHRNANGVLKFAKRSTDKSAHYALVVTGHPVEYQPPLPDCAPLIFPHR